MVDEKGYRVLSSEPRQGLSSLPSDAKWARLGTDKGDKTLVSLPFRVLLLWQETLT